MPAGNPTTVYSVLHYDNKVNWIEYLKVVNWIASVMLDILLSSMKSKVIVLVTITDGQVHITHAAASARLQTLAFLAAFFEAASLGFLWPVINVNWHDNFLDCPPLPVTLEVADHQLHQCHAIVQIGHFLFLATLRCVLVIL